MAVAATTDPVWSLTTPVIFPSDFSTSGNSDNENCNEQKQGFLDWSDHDLRIRELEDSHHL
jgi:hypothetical protein